MDPAQGPELFTPLTISLVKQPHKPGLERVGTVVPNDKSLPDVAYLNGRLHLRAPPQRTACGSERPNRPGPALQPPIALLESKSQKAASVPNRQYPDTPRYTRSAG